MRRKVLLILAVPALFMLSIFFLMSDINKIPEDTTLVTPPLVSNTNNDQPVDRKRPTKPHLKPPPKIPDEANEVADVKTIDDDLIRPFPRPGNKDSSDNNFNFGNDNKGTTTTITKAEDDGNNHIEHNDVKNDQTNGNVHDNNSNNKDNTDGTIPSDSDGAQVAGGDPRQKAVRDAYLHSWNSYKQFAFGKDELQPPYRSGKDWLGMGLSIVDSIDTMWLMGLQDEYKVAREWIDKNLHFDVDRDISVFETTIRVLGGLVSIYDMTNDEMYIRKAEELAKKLLPAFNTPSGYAKTTINLRSGHISNPAWTGGTCILSETGTMQMEFASITKHTGNKKYQETTIKTYDTLDRITKPGGLYPVYLDPDSGDFRNNRVTLGALGDSYYEYLLKYWILTGKKHDKYRRMYEEAMDAVISTLVQKSTPSGLAYIAEKEGGGLSPKMDHLVCFAGAMFALGAHHKAVKDVSKHMELGEEITRTCHEFYNRSATGLGPEIVRFRSGADFYTEAGHASTYILRPETVESYFVLYWITGDKKYQDWGWEAFQAIETHCRTRDGYCGVRDVRNVPVEHDDVQQSFFMAETLKYLYLLFSPRDTLELDKWVFNTEAHPIKVW